MSDVHALAAQVRRRCKKGGGGGSSGGGGGGNDGGGGNGSATPRGGHFGLPSACTLVECLSAAPCACWLMPERGGELLAVDGSDGLQTGWLTLITAAGRQAG